MTKFKISGVWKDSNNVITDYAFHTVTENGVTRANKKSKEQAIQLLETTGNSAVTRMWNYTNASWKEGEPVEVVSGNTGKFLRSDPNNKLTDNLGHLIDYDWLNQ